MKQTTERQSNLKQRQTKKEIDLIEAIALINKDFAQHWLKYFNNLEKGDISYE